MAYAGFIVMGIGSSVIAPTAFSLVGASAAPEARARAVARATLFGYLGYFIGPPGFGFIAGSLGLRYAFVFAAVILLLVPVLARIMARRG
jgi:MFS family permease